MKDIERNLDFLLLEVKKQLQSTYELLGRPSELRIQKIENRDDYLDNLKTVIQNHCYSYIHGEGSKGPLHLARLQAFNTISANLERIGDLAVNVACQVAYFSDPMFISRYDYHEIFGVIFHALEQVHPAVFQGNLSVAFGVCQAEPRIDALFARQFQLIREEFNGTRNAEDLFTTLFIMHYLERIGDALLNIGEAAILAITGHRMKIKQYHALRDAVAASGEELPITEVEFRSIWGTRSGARIGKLQRCSPDSSSTQDFIFKQGNREKLLLESENIRKWESLQPGLAPKVHFQQEEGKDATLLVECLRGVTLEDLLLTAELPILKAALAELETSAESLWTATMKSEPINGRFIEQCRSRLRDVFLVHPELKLEEFRLCGITIPSLEERLHRAEKIGRALNSPFSVFIHGDFNTNNILFDLETESIHYIDLHRSTDFDYVQDVSVFLVSNLRLPVFDSRRRARIIATAMEFYRFAAAFAAKWHDETFQARLCLALVRSFITSSRFEYSKPFAHNLARTGIYLLDKITAFEGDYAGFRIPPDLWRH
jgi:phosphate uptake regulator